MSPDDHNPFFRWGSLRTIQKHDLNTRPAVPGMMLEVELTSGETIRVWRGDDGQSYFCHGLTFGGKDSPGGPISPYTGPPVETILARFFAEVIPEVLAKPSDIVVWRSPDPLESTPHSAIITQPVVLIGTNYLGYETKLLTKNGVRPEVEMTFEDLVAIYGETYNVYSRKGDQS